MNYQFLLLLLLLLFTEFNFLLRWRHNLLQKLLSESVLQAQRRATLQTTRSTQEVARGQDNEQ